MITITNKTSHPQALHTFNGMTIIVASEEHTEIDEKDFFPEELERIKKFFYISEKKVTQEKDIARTSKRKYDYEDGGKE